MTTLVAIRDSGARCIRYGTDTRVSGYNTVSRGRVCKFIANEKAVLMYAGALLGLNIIHQHREKILESDDPVELVKRLKKILSDQNWEGEAGDNGNPRLWNMGMLMLRASDLSMFDIDANFAWFEVEGDYIAAGSGEDCALGALKVLTQAPNSVAPEEKVKWAINAAAEDDFYTNTDFMLGELRQTPEPGSTQQYLPETT